MSRAGRAVKRNAGIHPTSRSSAYASSGRGATMRPSQAVGPRGVVARRPRGTPLPPRGIASGNPVITGVQAYGKSGFIFTGQDLDKITICAKGCEDGQGNPGNGLWIKVGKHVWTRFGQTSHNKGGWTLGSIVQKTPTKLIVQQYGAFVGPVTIKAVANDTGSGRIGALVKDTALPGQVIFATGTKK